MKSNTEILHYIIVVLGHSEYTIRRVDMPVGYCIMLEVGGVKFLFTREDVKDLVFLEELNWALQSTLPYEMQRVLEYGTEYVEEGGEE